MHKRACVAGVFILMGMPLTGQQPNRDEAIRKGIAYIDSVARNPAYRVEYGSDLLWCLYSLSVTSADAEIRRATEPMARAAAREWISQHRTLPAQASPDDLVDYATAIHAAERMGLKTGGLPRQIRRRALEIEVKKYYGFNPRQEAPPPGGNRYDIWCDALITAEAGELIGVPLGATFAEVIRWLPSMRPYPKPQDDPHFFSTLNAITHTIYAINDYGVYAADRECLGPEFEYLRTNWHEALRLKDPEIMGEFIDTLRAFGMTERDPEIQSGVEFLLSTQNADGSWGDAKSKDVYTRYHSTWTAVDGLREYRFQAAKPCPIKR